MDEVHARFRLHGGFRSSALRLCVGAIAAASLVGCTTGDKQTELESVAKDWSMVIRASQVIPVYPLTEDIQPGDIFLVNRTVQEQHKQYTEDGFLPLDAHIARLDPAGFADFYSHSFRVGGADATVPNHWLKPGTGKEKAWLDAPQAGFPSYKFSVKRGGGFNAALPISGVPVGLTLLGSDAADGSITIDKAKTYGIDTLSLYSDLITWSKTPAARDYLIRHVSDDTTEHYLRVITRVYLTGRMLVQLNSTASSSAGVSVGAAKPVELLTASPNADPAVATAEQYEANVGKINTLLEKSLLRTQVETAAGTVNALLPGATLKVVAASSRSITMAEDFIDRPLVIGYLGFDVKIGPDGRLGLATQTRDVLENARTPTLSFTPAESDLVHLRKVIQEHREKNRIARRVAELVGEPFTGALADPDNAAEDPYDIIFIGNLVSRYLNQVPHKREERLNQLTDAMRMSLSEASGQ